MSSTNSLLHEGQPIAVYQTNLESAHTSFPLAFSSSPPVLDVQSPLDAQINLKLQNILMLLKRCCNHPYLVEYPLDPATQEFKVTHSHLHFFGTVTVIQVLLNFGAFIVFVIGSRNSTICWFIVKQNKGK